MVNKIRVITVSKQILDAINQNIALEARELKYRQTIEALNKKVKEQEEVIKSISEKPKSTRTKKTSSDTETLQ